jgi:hypothetical protein
MRAYASNIRATCPERIKACLHCISKKLLIVMHHIMNELGAFTAFIKSKGPELS